MFLFGQKFGVWVEISMVYSILGRVRVEPAANIRRLDKSQGQLFVNLLHHGWGHAGAVKEVVTTTTAVTTAAWNDKFSAKLLLELLGCHQGANRRDAHA